MINTITKSNLYAGGFILPHSLQSIPKGSQGRKQAVVVLTGLLGLLSHIPRTTFLGDGTTRSGLIPPIPNPNEENATQTYLQANLIGDIFSVEVPSLQKTLACVKLTKTSQRTWQCCTLWCACLTKLMASSLRTEIYIVCRSYLLLFFFYVIFSGVFGAHRNVSQREGIFLPLPPK